ncbi:hypothetical protein ACIN8IBEIGE_10033 [Acinetobacter sp. 8I-beige]|nr:hypothetical protein ACIN8IBEIGE_10033 [Acinetobacter sp. 8I-beige]
MNLMVSSSLKEILTKYLCVFQAIEQLFHLYPLEKNGYS